MVKKNIQNNEILIKLILATGSTLFVIGLVYLIAYLPYRKNIEYKVLNSESFPTSIVIDEKIRLLLGHVSLGKKSSFD